MAFNTIFSYLLFLVICFGVDTPGSNAIRMAFLRTALLVETSRWVVQRVFLKISYSG